MKIASWNVNSIRSRLERVIPWLAHQAPDVLCLQETKVQDDVFPAEPFADAGYHVVVHGQKTYNGVAIVARDAITDVARGFDDGDDDGGARFIAATVRGVRVMSAYIPNGKDIDHEHYRFKLGWLERLRAYVDARSAPTDPLVLAGDFNVTADDRDVHDPDAWRGRNLCSEPERERLAALGAWGMLDSLREMTADAGLYSWWDYRRLGFPKNRGLRIDYVFISRGLRPRLVAAGIDRAARKGPKPSDHAPVWVQLAGGGA